MLLALSSSFWYFQRSVLLLVTFSYRTDRELVISTSFKALVCLKILRTSSYEPYKAETCFLILSWALSIYSSAALTLARKTCLQAVQIFSASLDFFQFTRKTSFLPVSAIAAFISSYRLLKSLNLVSMTAGKSSSSASDSFFFVYLTLRGGLGSSTCCALSFGSSFLLVGFYTLLPILNYKMLQQGFNAQDLFRNYNPNKLRKDN